MRSSRVFIDTRMSTARGGACYRPGAVPMECGSGSHQRQLSWRAAWQIDERHASAGDRTLEAICQRGDAQSDKGKSGAISHVRPSAGGPQFLALIGHELQRALEVIQHRDVVDVNTMHRRSGTTPVGLTGYETSAARGAGDAALDELSRTLSAI